MKFIIAPDKFKGSLSGFQFCDAVEKGLRIVFPKAEIIQMPLADGGDGTIDVVKYYLKGEKIKVKVNDPFFRSIEASYLYAKKSKIAFIEMAEASGLKLLSEEEKNCLESSTLGTGELILDAIKKGVSEIILGIGGSATNDGGMGMAKALGFRFFDSKGQELEPIGRNLIHVHTIDESQAIPRLKEVTFKIACDVANPFYGANGAAHVYAAQKGASNLEIHQLDLGLQNYASVIAEQFDIDLQKINGSGAAGGIGGGAIVFLNGTLTSGIALIKELANFDSAIKAAHWIITGEGKLDDQTLSGKTISGVVTSAQKQNIPVAAFCGSVHLSVETQIAVNLSYVTSIVIGPCSLETAIKSSFSNLKQAAFNFAKLLKVSST